MGRFGRTIAFWGLLASAAPALGGAPQPLSAGGRLTDASGQPLAGPVALVLKFFDAATGGNQLGGEIDDANVALTDGVFQAPIALDGSTAQTVFGAGAPVYLEVTDATHGKTYPRQQLNAVPFAMHVPVDGTTITYVNGALTVPGASTPPTANAGQSGFLATSDWAQFNSAPSKAYVDSAVAVALKKDGSVPLTGGLNAGAQDVTNVGNLLMVGGKVFGLSVATSDPANLTASDIGKIWYNGGIRLWNGTSAQSLGISGAGLLSINSLSSSAQTLTTGTAGMAPGWVSAGATHTLNLPMANGGAVTAGLISNAEWLLFNGKQPALAPAAFTVNGFLASGDWGLFNAKQNVLAAANNAGAGFLTPGDWSTFNGREPALTAGGAGQYYRGDKTWQTLSTGAVVETSGLYYTSARAQSDARAAVSGAAPLQYTGATGAFALPPATASGSGYLASADWAQFNAKQNALGAAGSGAAGFLSSADWTAFNAKQNALGAAAGGANGYLLASDWTAFNGKQPLLSPATATTTGYLSSGDWSTFNSRVSPWLTIGTTAFYNNGSVGIGTTSPLATLHVGAGSAASGMSPTIFATIPGNSTIATRNSTSNIEAFMLAGTHNGDSGAIFGSSTGHPVFLRTGGTTDVMTLTTGGSVGIGTTNPQSALEVKNGRVRDQSGFVTPVGSIVAFGGATVPTGWLLCDGTAVSRATYSDLFTALSTVWGNGDGSTTFNVPDLRGRFLRGVDGGVGNDPDRATRTACTPGGNSGDNVGSCQSDQYASHTHTISGTTYGTPSGAVNGSTVGGGTGASGAFASTLGANAAGGNETRPKNADVKYIIKY